MANVATNSPIILDTAADNILAGPLHITKIKWVAPPAAGATMQLEDGKQRVIWKSTVIARTAETIPEPESDFDPPLFVNGLSLGTDGGGELFVYYDDPTPRS